MSINDDRYVSNQVQHINKGQLTVRNRDNVCYNISMENYNNSSDDVQHVNKGMVVVKDRDGNRFRVPKDDPRYLSGELVGISKGSKFKIKPSTCPHCGKVGGGGAMKRFHFDNCKTINKNNE